MQKENSSELPLTDDFGICRQTILPLYLKPSVESRLVSELLFGECYQAIAKSTDQKWVKIIQEDIGVSGWISSNSFKNLSPFDYQIFLNKDFQIVTSPIAAIEFQGAIQYLLPGSKLHFSDSELFNWQDHIGFTGSVRSHAIKADRAELIEIILKFENSPYYSGGRSIFGLDPTQGFELIASIAGYKLNSQKIPRLKLEPTEILPGDLYIFRSLETDQSYYGFSLEAGKVMWMDNRMRVTDMKEWRDFVRNNSDEQVVLETISIVG